MPVMYNADLNGWLESDLTLAEWSKRMWKTAKFKIYANPVEFKYYVTSHGLRSGPFETYHEAHREWLSVTPITQQRDAYMDWREANPRHAYALENHHHHMCIEKVNNPEFSEEEMEHLWQTATMFENGYQPAEF